MFGNKRCVYACFDWLFPYDHTLDMSKRCNAEQPPSLLTHANVPYTLTVDGTDRTPTIRFHIGHGGDRLCGKRLPSIAGAGQILGERLSGVQRSAERAGVRLVVCDVCAGRPRAEDRGSVGVSGSCGDAALHCRNGGGKLFFEIGYDQADQVKQLMEEAGFKDIEVVQDYAHLDRVVWGRI